MKKIISLSLAMLLMSVSLLFVPAYAETGFDFDVSYEEASRTFAVSGRTAKASRLLLLVKNASDELVYMNAENETNGIFYFDVKPNQVKEGVYTFILSADNGDGTETAVKTCQATQSAPTDWVTAAYHAETRTFTITGTLEETGNLMLLGYAPGRSGGSEIFYMDAVNQAAGAFSFTVPLAETFTGGTYSFVISVNGGEKKKAVCNVLVSDGFDIFGSLTGGDTVGGTYTLQEGEEAATVVAALYKKGADSSLTLCKVVYSSEVKEGKVTAALQLPETVTAEGYTAKAFVLKNMSSLVPMRSEKTVTAND